MRNESYRICYHALLAYSCIWAESLSKLLSMPAKDTRCTPEWQQQLLLQWSSQTLLQRFICIVRCSKTGSGTTCIWMATQSLLPKRLF